MCMCMFMFVCVWCVRLCGCMCVWVLNIELVFSSRSVHSGDDDNEGLVECETIVDWSMVVIDAAHIIVSVGVDALQRRLDRRVSVSLFGISDDPSCRSHRHL